MKAVKVSLRQHVPIKLSSPSHNHLFAFQIISWGFRYVCVPVFWSWTSAVCFESTSRYFKRRHVISIFYRQWFGLELHKRVFPCEFQSRKRFFQAPKNEPLVSSMEKFKPSKIAKYPRREEVFEMHWKWWSVEVICMDNVGCVVQRWLCYHLREVKKRASKSNYFLVAKLVHLYCVPVRWTLKATVDSYAIPRLCNTVPRTGAGSHAVFKNL